MTERNEKPRDLESLLHADGVGPALRIDAAAAQRLIDGALAGALSNARGATVTPLRSRRVFWLLAAAIFFTGSAAAMYAVQRGREHETASKPKPAPARAVQPQPAAPEPQVAAAAQPQPQPQAAVVPQPTAPARHAARDAGPARAGEGRVQDLLRRANRLRGAGDYAAAEHTYLRVVAQSPSGAPAYTARVAAAGLRLERLSDPRGALQLYQQALRADPAGPLGPEIHEGIAQAHRKLGNARDERRALQALLAAESQGPAAERARARLQALSER